MLKLQVIKLSKSPWAAPLILVKKKFVDGSQTYKPCVDFRGLNHVTKKTMWPVTHIPTVLENVGGATFYSVFDLCFGYWLLKIYSALQEYTAFSTPDWH